MSVFFAIAICFLPLAVLMVVSIVILQVKILRVLFAALLGLIAVLPILFVQFFVGDLRIFNEFSFGSELFRALILNGAVEEIWKAAMLFLFPFKKMTLKEAFACALVVGLSLGCFESSVYFLKHLQMANASGGVLLYRPILLRVFSADLIHLWCTGLSGIFVWAFVNKKRCVLALVFAIISHGLYNFFSMYTTGIKYFAVAAILFAMMECRVRFSKLCNPDEQDDV